MNKNKGNPILIIIAVVIIIVILFGLLLLYSDLFVRIDEETVYSRASKVMEVRVPTIEEVVKLGYGPSTAMKFILGLQPTADVYTNVTEDFTLGHKINNGSCIPVYDGPVFQRTSNTYIVHIDRASNIVWDYLQGSGVTLNDAKGYGSSTAVRRWLGYEHPNTKSNTSNRAAGGGFDPEYNTAVATITDVDGNKVKCVATAVAEAILNRDSYYNETYKQPHQFSEAVMNGYNNSVYITLVLDHTDGSTLYLPLAIGDGKYHSAPVGFFQTNIANAKEGYWAEGMNNDPLSDKLMELDSNLNYFLTSMHNAHVKGWDGLDPSDLMQSVEICDAYGSGQDALNDLHRDCTLREIIVYRND